MVDWGSRRAGCDVEGRDTTLAIKLPLVPHQDCLVFPAGCLGVDNNSAGQWGASNLIHNVSTYLPVATSWLP